MTDSQNIWEQPTNPHTTKNIAEIRAQLGDIRGDLRRVVEYGEPNDLQREAVEEAWRLLGQVRALLAPAAVDR